MNVGSFGLNRTGHGGSARDSNVAMAQNFFCNFLKCDKVQLMGEEEENNLESWINSKPNAMEAVCDIEVIQQFSSWLCHYARKGNGEILKLGSILDILSCTKKLFNTLFPSNTIFSGNKDQVWYTNLRAKSNQEIIRRNIKLGVASSNKSKPIGRALMKNVNETLLSINSYQSIRKAVYVGSTFNTAGRSGEAAYMCFDEGCYWDYDDEKLYFHQKEMKVGEEKNNNFVSDAESYVIDQYWLFSIYYITGGGSHFENPNNSHSHFVFPELYDKESGSKGATSAYISTILKDLMPNVENQHRITASLLWESDVTGTSLRRGSARVMVRKVPMQAVVAKTGHDMKGSRESSVWEYIDGDDVLLGYGSAALSGWTRPLDPIFPPTLRRLSSGDNNMKLSSLASLLFDHSIPLTKVRNIKGFVDTLLATFLMYLGDFTDDCNNKYNIVGKSENKNKILEIFEDKIKGLFTMDECLAFGLLVRNEWEERNGLQESTSDMKGIVLGMDRVQAECLKIRSENRDLKLELNNLKEESKRNNQLMLGQKAKLSQIAEMLEKIMANQTDSPSQSVISSKKRVYSDLSLPVDLTEESSKGRGKFTLV
jgi:hypothetical protein